jgi:spectinomycin phosphotransferase
MLTKPDISDDSIIACLRDSYGLRISQAAFLPIGADVNSAVYRVSADDGTSYFLKLRRGDFDDIAVEVPAFLHAQGIPRVMAPIAAKSHELSVRAHGFDWMLYPFFDPTTRWKSPIGRTRRCRTWNSIQKQAGMR